MRKGKTTAKRRGRPPLPPERERFAVKTRLSKDLLDKLEAARKETGRSMAQELEFRLEQSFQIEQMKSDLRLFITDAVKEATATAAGSPSLLMHGEEK
jgi:hypothetical protein